MKAIKTKPDCTLGFVKIPEIKVPFQGHSENVLRFSEVTKESLDGSGFSWFKEEDSFEAIGKLSEVTEEQARELVEEINGATLGNKPLPMYKNYLLGTILTDAATYSLKTAAISAGIKEEDFGNYLVIKL